MASISLWLDKRVQKKNGLYPLKIQVYHDKKRKYYSTGFDVDIEFYNEAIVERKTFRKKEKKDLQKKFQKVLKKAHDVTEDLDPFSFELFEKRLYRKKGEGTKLQYHFASAIGKYKTNGKFNTASSYECAEKAIIRFKDVNTYSQLNFSDITTDWLKEFETYLVKDENLSRASVGVYCRNIRALFNKAITEKEIDRENYPFSKRKGDSKYKIPKARKVKKALNSEELTRLFYSETDTANQEKARDFWYFSYACNGMNLKDIALLKYKNLEDDKFKFVRAKTEDTSAEVKTIVVYLNDFSKGVIEKYSTRNKGSENYVFDIVDVKMSEEEKQRKIKLFTRYINEHIKKIATKNGISDSISFVWARHSYTTLSIRNGASMAFIQESLGHENITTTQNYFKGFDSEAKKDMADKIMDF